jgi:tetratricopeptide (TPR) repeat protein
MPNQVKLQLKPPAWLKTSLVLGFWLVILFPFAGRAQDKIYKTDKSIIEAKVMEISGAEIKYKKFSNQTGPTYIVAVKDVSMIVYENGEKEVYNQQQTNAAVTQEPEKSVPASREKARNTILAENRNEAIAVYSKLVSTDASNATLLAEDAYALALSGIYDAALMRLDLSWSNWPVTSDVKFFTAQVFSLMGYDDLAKEFWKPAENTKAPAWISSKASYFVQKYACRHPHSSIKNREQLIAGFKHANELAAQNSYCQAIALFNDITSIYPKEYLPFVGYSITLEKAGAFSKSVQTIEKAISLIGNTAENNTTKQMLEQRLTSLQQIMKSPSIVSPPKTDQNAVPQPARLQMMAYAGGMVSPGYTNINGRIGYFISGSTNASLDLGIIKNENISSTTAGLSVYSRVKNFVSGAGISLYSANSNENFAVKFSVGYSKMNKTHKSSLDIFLDFNRGLGQNAITTYVFSVGTSFYFGKRK